MLLQKRWSNVLSLVLVVTALFGQTAFAADANGKLEVFSWWTSGGEAAALQSLFDAYKTANPDIEIVNATVAGGSAARGVLQTRLAGGTPPDTWQVHLGFELIGQYVESNFVAPLTDLYKANGWFDVTPLCVGDSGIWATAQLLENTLVGVLGQEKYNGL